MSNAPVRIIQISDTHLFSDPETSLLGVNTHESFQAVIDLIQKKEKKIDFILVTGDLTQDYSAGAYIWIADMLNAINVPIYCVAGNHDDPKVMAEIYPRGFVSNKNHILLKHWQLILLNSHKHKSVDGFLDQTELKHLQDCLQTHPDYQAIIAFHHHPVKVGSLWLDKLGLTNADEFWRIVSHYPQVKAVFFGHVHQVNEQEVKGVKCYSAPSTCIQFKRQQDKFGLEKSNQGYRWIELGESGIKTGVERLENYSGVFEKDSKGY